MVYNFTKEEWTLLGDMLGAVKHLQEELMAKGYGVICTFSSGVYPAELCFIVDRNHTKMFSFVSFDLLSEQERLKAELFEKGERLLSVDVVEEEKRILLARLEELNRPTNGCRG